MYAEGGDLYVTVKLVFHTYAFASALFVREVVPGHLVEDGRQEFVLLVFREGLDLDGFVVNFIDDIPTED